MKFNVVLTLVEITALCIVIGVGFYVTTQGTGNPGGGGGGGPMFFVKRWTGFSFANGVTCLWAGASGQRC
ncbi:hypothetical protein ACVWY0_003818, partial [Arthrobacter sp. UYNi723]